MSEHCFTPETARRALERLRPSVERVCRLFRELERRRPHRILCDQPVERGYLSRVEAIHGSLLELARQGVQVRDLRRGLVAFPARLGGRPVLLCWRLGEPALRYWRELGAGFASRRPVDEDAPWE